MNNKQTIGLIIIAILCLLGLVVVLIVDPIAQHQVYHQFADQRQILTVPNFWDVVSNLPFLIVGLLGIKKLLEFRLKIIEEFKIAYYMFFIGITLVAVGSSYYHLAPTNQTLFWDRLPMSLAFMSLIAILIAEFVYLKVAKIMFWPVLILGALSVIYWIWTENAGQGDLRFYGLIQYLPMASIPVILLCFKSKFSQPSAYWKLFLCYLAAKLFEHFDKEIFSALGIISGHTLKHLVAALGLWILLKNYQKRSENL